ncbi:MAG: oxygen-independent coproporphyrinogen III oxidase [Rubrivivax sp.]|nr:oxygen-independent coproporphyrinogen III oxidase [Rubrivivax sp.]
MTQASIAVTGVVIDEALLRRLDQPGPRYTSYPTADRFSADFDARAYQVALQQRAQGHQVGGVRPLSVYVHVPFCESVCYYCACNKVVTRHHDRAAEYLDALATEMALHRAELGSAQTVTQLHLGGGTPTFLSDAELERLMADLRSAFCLDPQAEVSIEVDPRTANAERLAHLAALGFNRVSFGIQDFDPAVQVAVHRVQSLDSVASLIESSRALGFKSINADLIYGLPMQTPASFDRTIAQVAALRPDRIALYAYAHLPQRFKPQRRIDSADLPPPGDRLKMLGSAIAGFLSRGYQYIGMDHFALPDDELAVAKRRGRLHRNFQGYSTQPDCDLVGLGVSAIGRMGKTYSQNAKTLPEYYGALREQRFPVVRGLSLGRDDLLRRDVIMSLMCQGRLEYESIGLAHMVSVPEVLASEIEALAPFVDDGLVKVDDEGIEVTARGWYFVRGVAMMFDRYLKREPARDRFSRIV